MTAGNGGDRGNSGIIVNGNFSAGQVVTGDHAHGAMNIASGARLNVGSRHDSTNQQEARAALQQLLRDLNTALRCAPAERVSEAELLSSLATQLVRTAERPNAAPSTLQQICSGLRKTLGLLQGAAPDATSIVGQLVSLVSGLYGLSL